MKRQYKSIFLLIMACLLAGACSEDVGLKGRVRFSISGSASDDPNVTAVNLIITGFEGKKDGVWRALRSFDQPVGVNLVELVGGRSFVLVDQFIDPGLYTEFRVSLLLADPQSAVLRSPISTVDLKGGVSRPIFISGDAASFTFPGEMEVTERGVADYHLTIDVRKALQANTAQAFTFQPSVRLINVVDAGNLSGRLINATADETLRVFVYKPGSFTLTEADVNNGLRFARALEAAPVSAKRFQVGFMEAGTYDLVFVRVDEQGRFAGLRGVARGVEVAPRQTAVRDIDVKSLSAS